jgi:hypothetical protein
MFIDGIVLATLDRIEEDLGSLLDALEEVIILSATSSRLLIWVMAKDLLAMGALNLLFSSLVSVLG